MQPIPPQVKDDLTSRERARSMQVVDAAASHEEPLLKGQARINEPCNKKHGECDVLDAATSGQPAKLRKKGRRTMEDEGATQ